MLRWKDFQTGYVYSKPCVIDYLIKESRDYSTGGSSLVQPSGFVEIIVQFNPATNKIRPNRRFLFGNSDNWMAYKIMGGGVNNFNNNFTSEMNSVGLLRLSMLSNQVNEDTDDITNGVADFGEYVYSISLNSNNLSLTTGNAYTLLPTIELNGTTVTKNVIWSSNNTSVATVDSNGVVSPASIGSALIKCSLSDNSSVSDTCIVLVTSSSVNNYSIVLTPNKDYVYEGEEQVFTTTLYLNGISQANTFTYSLNTNGVPTDNFQYNILSGNTFWIRNLKRYDASSLLFTATSGATSIDIPVRLRGGW
jgi:uncharacterized protein YjdB